MPLTGLDTDKRVVDAGRQVQADLDVHLHILLVPSIPVLSGCGAALWFVGILHAAHFSDA